jgi:light-regulated signal transduction histidine kinase (bacteriophytochrome)
LAVSLLPQDKSIKAQRAEVEKFAAAKGYRIVRDHHGTVDVESREGEGTTFILTFPISGARAAVGGFA